MKIDNYIKEWSKIIKESQVNEVSDIDVDLDEGIITKKDYDNLHDYSTSKINLSNDDKYYIIDAVLFYLSYIKETDFKEFIQTSELKGAKKLNELYKKFLKWKSGEDATHDIQKIKSEY